MFGSNFYPCVCSKTSNLYALPLWCLRLWPLPCSFSVDRHCEQFECHAGELCAELLHRGQTSHHLCHRDRRRCHACTRWAAVFSPRSGNKAPRLYECFLVSVQEKQRTYQTLLKARQRPLEPSDLLSTMDYGLMRDGKKASFCLFIVSLINSCVVFTHNVYINFLIKW